MLRYSICCGGIYGPLETIYPNPPEGKFMVMAERKQSNHGKERTLALRKQRDVFAYVVLVRDVFLIRQPQLALPVVEIHHAGVALTNRERNKYARRKAKAKGWGGMNKRAITQYSSSICVQYIPGVLYSSTGPKSNGTVSFLTQSRPLP